MKKHIVTVTDYTGKLIGKIGPFSKDEADSTKEALERIGKAKAGLAISFVATEELMDLETFLKKEDIQP